MNARDQRELWQEEIGVKQSDILGPLNALIDQFVSEGVAYTGHLMYACT